jgi:tetratricopeptide (TPR) repeat protein
MAACALLGCPRLAAGDDADGGRSPSAAAAASPKTRALALFEQSLLLYRAGDLQRAVKLLEQAYAIFPEPVLLYDLARAHEGLGELAQAADAYERYLAADRVVADRGAIERRLETLREQIRSREGRRSQPGTAVVPWVIVGLGAVGVGAGIALDLAAQQRNIDAQNQSDAVKAQATQREAESLLAAANVSLIAGGAIMAAGATWGVVALATRKPEAGSALLEVRIGPGSAAIAGRF